MRARAFALRRPLGDNVRILSTFDEIRAAAGHELGTGDWLEVDQARIDAFADATGDHQWIHVDIERSAQGPFGRTVAHGYLTLSLLPWLGNSVYTLDTPGPKLNYGLDRVRFPSPVPVGARIRTRVTLTEVAELDTGLRLTLSHLVEVENTTKPACVADLLVLLLP
jgi:acyl dehydratase